MRTHLKILKARAADLVGPLVRSSLQFEGRGRLPYLTCVEVEGVPWTTEGEEEEEEGMNVD